MRRKMTKEVTKTTVKLAKMVFENEMPTAIPLPDEVLIGNVSQEKAQKEIQQKYDEPVTVFKVTPETVVYEMDVAKFIELATIKEDTPEEAKPDEAVERDLPDQA